MTNQKAMQLIQAAQAGDEAAFQDIFEAFRGLVWTLYRDHSLQTQQYDWEQESRLVLYQTLRKLKATHWGALTRYYNQAFGTELSNCGGSPIGTSRWRAFR